MKLKFIDPSVRVDNSLPLARTHADGKLFFNAKAIQILGLMKGQEFVVGTENPPGKRFKIYLVDAEELSKKMEVPPSVEVKPAAKYLMLSLRYVWPELGIDSATTKLVFSVEVGAPYKGVKRVIVLNQLSKQKRISTRPGRNVT